MLKKRGQVSLEYVMIIGFSLLILIPIVIIYGAESQAIKDQANMVQADRVAQKIVDAADQVYFMGEPAQATITVKMPYGVDSIDVVEREVSIFVVKSGRLVEIVGLADANMSGSISPKPGIRKITLTAFRSQVNVSSS